ncbi:MAG: hypothetical protein A3B38_01730 [Candidatus Levybacteria bacterium RIFCSPLOWO2_01_FULL_36_13]|nr:MAG: hypothetical protein A2684_02965 [Candidatus Levybacteria bacterium RIFCSPHIGHO2_01_FULL_36_15b]OGH35584.1 MAG: hypothetical protein A3B38_01730 [Candidatus Levybacteria bacterium RIFCSPLOWO2_01_FULL_36_13]
MRIAVFHELPPGGARNAVYALSRELIKLGHLIDFYYTGSQKEDDLPFKHIYFYNFSAKAWSGGDWKTRLYKDSLELIKLKKLHRKIALDINSKHYDAVLVNGSEYTEAPYVLRYLNLFSIFYCHDPNYRIIYEPILAVEGFSIKALYEKLNRFFRRMIDKKNFSSASEIYVNSQFASKVVKKTYGTESRVVYLGVDTKFFKPSKDVNKTIDVLFIGSKHPIDGYEFFKSATKKIKYKLRVKTVLNEDQWLTTNDIKDLYLKSRIVICFAVNEPFGLVALEAMSCGVVVIAVNEGGYKETIINGKTGILIKRNSSILANKISYLLRRPTTIRNISAAAREHVVLNWDWELKSKAFSNEIENSLKTLK